jgi:hypothetical protein
MNAYGGSMDETFSTGYHSVTMHGVSSAVCQQSVADWLKQISDHQGGEMSVTVNGATVADPDILTACSIDHPTVQFIERWPAQTPWLAIGAGLLCAALLYAILIGKSQKPPSDSGPTAQPVAE